MPFSLEPHLSHFEFTLHETEEGRECCRGYVGVRYVTKELRAENVVKRFVVMVRTKNSRGAEISSEVLCEIHFDKNEEYWIKGYKRARDNWDGPHYSVRVAAEYVVIDWWLQQ